MLKQKKTANVAIKTTEQVKEDLAQRAASVGMTASDFGHHILVVALYGREHADSLHNRLMCVVSGPVTKDLPDPPQLRAVEKK